MFWGVPQEVAISTNLSSCYYFRGKDNDNLLISKYIISKLSLFRKKVVAQLQSDNDTYVRY